MSDNFKKGYEYVIQNLAAATGATKSQQWLDEIQKCIKDTSEKMIEEANAHGYIKPKQLQGFMNEVWHEKTFNLNAVIHDTGSVAEKLGENGLGSVDIKVKTTEGIEKKFSLKSYADAKGAVKAQSETKWERFNQNAHKQHISVEEYMSKHPDDIDDNIKLSMYHGQGKIISSEQLADARELLRKKIDTLSNRETDNPNNDIQILRYKEVLDTIDSVVKDGKGTESIELTHQQAIDLATAAKKGEVDEELLKKVGIDINKLVNAEDIARESLKAGLTAATLTAMISVAPIIVNSVSKLLAEGEFDVEAFKQGGINALSTSSRSFLNGTITAAINVCCQTGKFGKAFLNTNSALISTMVVITTGTIDSALKLATGKITKGEMARDIMRMYMTTGFACATGIAFTVLFDGFPLAYMVGSLIGSMLGGILYSTTEKLFISFFVDSGCTFFGLVDQNYEVPQEVIEDLGLDGFEYKQFEADEYKYNEFKPEVFSINEFEYEHFGIKVLKRGMLEVDSVGYTY